MVGQFKWICRKISFARCFGYNFPRIDGELGGGISFKGAHFGQDIMLIRVRWHVADPSSYRQLESMMQEPVVSVDRAIINR